MFGVVLWSDARERKAVIWCEDHGDLAFYRQPEEEPGAVVLDPGDYVQFELTVERRMRLAHNPSIVSEGAYADLPRQLGTASAPVPALRDTARILPFAAPATARKADTRRVAAGSRNIG